MNLIILLTGLVRLLVVAFWTWREKDKARKEVKKVAKKELKKGIKHRDPCEIIAAFNKARNL